MCGRIRQAREVHEYGETLRTNMRKILDDGLKYNVPPGTRPIVFHRIGDGTEQFDRLFWGYKPPWYKRGPASNARLDTVLKGSPFWKPILTRRIIVPADGWYEWTGEKGDKQPWYISPKDEAPILMAGITAWEPGKDVLAETGFAIVTDDAAGGMVDIHDRRPICLSPDNALEWVDPGITVNQALEILSTPRSESAFHWWQVTKKIGNSRYQLADAGEPI
ncbi:SOS response-associated peptidase [Pusillimonas sp. DMV24BSW_D]|uniref:SOS response-associated peptidase n=1 Tax=Neopusillimonas aestuarii TaxID=2716226 RepID=UPI001409FF15|nr:SOS response-associated peptidase [Pusillimonas sp. DMV24BSW_D]QIM49004.1 SOS response-associated peptidase [Pusillimonas sp. DMV24BSW_D]